MLMPNDLFRPVQRHQAPRGVVAQFQHLIATRHLTPGDRLPPERELARILGVGRSTLREAMRALESLEIVETRPGQGTFLRVAEIPLTILARPVVSCPAFRMVMEARHAVEPTIAALAAARVTPAALRRLHQALTDQATQIEQGENWTAGDLAFHAELSRAAGNGVLHHFLESLEVVLRAGREAVERPGGGRPRQSLHEHQDILGAVAERNAPVAERRMVAHLEAVRAWADGLPCWCGTCGSGAPETGAPAASAMASSRDT